MNYKKLRYLLFLWFIHYKCRENYASKFHQFYNDGNSNIFSYVWWNIDNRKNKQKINQKTNKTEKALQK